MMNIEGGTYPDILGPLRNGLPERFNTMNDALFKFIFGKDEHKAITIDLLNTFLGGTLKKRIVDLTFLPTEHAPDGFAGKAVRFDVSCRLDAGEYVDIEVQVADESDMDRRTLYYWAVLYCHQLHAGEIYENLRPVLTLNILDFVMFERNPDPVVHYQITDARTGIPLNDDMHLYFIEVPKLRKKTGLSKAERWIAFFSRKLTARQKEALAMQDDAIGKAISATRDFFGSSIYTKAYIDREIAELDRRSQLANAEARGETKGLAKGRAEGRAEGLAEGRAEGRAEGIADVILSMLKQKGLSLSIISTVTSVPESRVIEIAREHGLPVPT